MVAILTTIVAAGLVLQQLSDAQDPRNQMSLANLDQRVSLLERATNAVQRDEMCIPLAAEARSVDAALKPGARVFLTGMLGSTNAPALGFYYFFRNYLFPHPLNISLDRKAVYHEDGFTGIPCDSPEVLKTNGFDLMIIFANNQMQFDVLTTNALRNPE